MKSYNKLVQMYSHRCRLVVRVSTQLKVLEDELTYELL